MIAKNRPRQRQRCEQECDNVAQCWKVKSITEECGSLCAFDARRFQHRICDPMFSFIKIILSGDRCGHCRQRQRYASHLWIAWRMKMAEPMTHPSDGASSRGTSVNVKKKHHPNKRHKCEIVSSIILLP